MGIFFPSRLPRYQVAQPPRERPVLLFDGDCGFCRSWIARWEQLTAGRVDYAPSQEAGAQFPEIPREAYSKAVQFVALDGGVYSGADAVFRSLDCAPGRGWGLWLYRYLPGFALLTEWFYELVALNRKAFSVLTRWFYGSRLELPTYFVSRWLFLKALGLVYLIAFISLWTQVDGLIGSHGIAPVRDYLTAIHDNYGSESYWVFPSLCWLDSSDAFLHFLCGGGTALAALLILGIAPAFCLFGLWVFYLSLVLAGQIFLGYQWDAMLLEAGFAAIFLAPLRLRPGLALDVPVSRAARWLQCWLLFRVVFSSGVVKLASGDRNWWHWTALNYHYETQPLPDWISWHLHHLPAWFQSFSVLALFVIELPIPFLIFGPRRLRYIAFAAIVGFQVILEVTGNYCFFNLLIVSVCLLLLDDAVWPRRWRPKSAVNHEPQTTNHEPRFGRWPGWIVVPLALAITLLSAERMFGRFGVRIFWMEPLSRAADTVEPFRSINSYGVFAVMTTSRPEIIIEGSDDGETWQPYEFHWKPGDLNRAPAFVAPHQPRLDWQMWFEAMRIQPNRWFMQFMKRLLEGSPEVLSLLDKNPFPQAPPHYIRAQLYDYHFTGAEDSGPPGERVWWRRTYKRTYAGPLSLR